MVGISEIKAFRKRGVVGGGEGGLPKEKQGVERGTREPFEFFY